MPKKFVECNHCKGTCMEFPDCEECEGYGWVYEGTSGGTCKCSSCGGEECSTCDGEGVVEAV